MYTTWVCEVLLEASFPPVMAEVRLGGDDDSPALSTLLANDSRAGGAAKPGEVPGVVMEVERRNLEAAAARAAAAPFAAFFAPFCLPLFVISTSCNRAKGFVITNTSSFAEITTFCRLKKGCGIGYTALYSSLSVKKHLILQARSQRRDDTKDYSNNFISYFSWILNP